MKPDKHRPVVGIFKFASCDGCQLTLLDCEDELLAVAGAVEIRYFPEASRNMGKGPFDIAFVEGSITTHHDADRIQQVRRQSRLLVALGACATAGGIQALRNWQDSGEYVRLVYAKPDYISTLKTSTPVAEHVPVDYELRGCPIQKAHFLEMVCALLTGRRPQLPSASLCIECKRKGNTCVLVANGEPCLGPATQAGCGAICPAMGRACYGCFGPHENANAPALAKRLREDGMSEPDLQRAFRTFNAWAWQFRKVSEEVETR
jgi:coenzyme F420-reducing hydrogenase gamma subunit